MKVNADRAGAIEAGRQRGSLAEASVLARSSDEDPLAVDTGADRFAKRNLSRSTVNAILSSYSSPAIVANEMSSRSMSGPAGWYTSSVAPALATSSRRDRRASLDPENVTA